MSVEKFYYLLETNTNVVIVFVYERDLPRLKYFYSIIEKYINVPSLSVNLLTVKQTDLEELQIVRLPQVRFYHNGCEYKALVGDDILKLDEEIKKCGRKLQLKK